MLESNGCRFEELTGQVYDSGMAVDVLTTEEDLSISSGNTIIKEMVTPIIFWKDQLISPGQVILVKGAKDATNR